MGPIKYCLCKKPIIGTIMWVLSLCVFPPPIPPSTVSLEKPGIVYSGTFEAPVEKHYSLVFLFGFKSSQERVNDKIIGSFRYDVEVCDCNNRIIKKPDMDVFGKMIPIRVVIKKIPESTVVLDETFETLCSYGFDGKNRKYRRIGGVRLTRGQFSIEVINILAQPELTEIQTQIELVSETRGKY